jgi:hypothetical protein
MAEDLMPGHTSSGGFQAGLQAEAEIGAPFEAVEQDELMFQHGPRTKRRVASRPQGGTWPPQAKLPVNWPLKCLMARERREWTSRGAAVSGV